MARIPTPEATEVGFDDFKRAAYGARPNPNVPPGGMSPEAAAWQSARTAPPAPGVATGPAQPFSGARVPPAGGPIPGASWTDKLNNFTDRVNAASEAQRAGIGNVTQGARSVAGQIGNFGKAVGNAARAVAANPLVRSAGVVGGALGGISEAGETRDAIRNGDAAGAVSHGLNTLAAGSLLSGAAAPLGMAYGAGHLIGTGADKILQMSDWGNNLRDKIGASINHTLQQFGGGVDDSAYQAMKNGQLPTAPALGARANPVPAAGPLPSTAPASGQSPAAPSNLPPGWQERQVDGAPGVNRMTTPDGRVLYTNVAGPSNAQLMGARGNVTSMPAMAPEDIKAALARRDAMSVADMRGPGDMVSGGMQTQAIGIGQPGTGNGGVIGNPGARSTIASWSPNGMGSSRAERIARMQMEHDTQMKGMDRDMTLRGQDIALRGQDQNYNLGARGQDLTLMGHQISAAGQRARLMYEMGKDNRDFGLRAAEFGETQQKNAFEQRKGREEQLQKNIENIVPHDSDGKPNAAMAAAFRSGIDRSVGRLGLDGAHQLSPMDEQRLLAGSTLLQRMHEQSGLLPWKPDQLRTIDPVDLTNLRVLPNGDRQITRKDSRAAGQIIPKRFFDTEEANYFMPGTKTNRFDILHETK